MPKTASSKSIARSYRRSAPATTLVRRRGPGRSPTEERVEDVAERPESTTEALETAGGRTLDSGVAEHVVRRATLPIRQHPVRLVQLLESILRAVVLVDVGVMLLGEATECPLDLGIVGVSGDPEHLVVVTFHGHGAPIIPTGTQQRRVPESAPPPRARAARYDPRMPAIAISADHARRFLVLRHLLAPPRALPPDAESVMTVIGRLGLLQFDPLEVPGARNHDLVLHARIAGYRREWCEQHLYGPDRRLIELYNKSLNLVPIDELPRYRVTWDRNRAEVEAGILTEQAQRVRVQSSSAWPPTGRSRPRHSPSTRTPSTGGGLRPAPAAP